MYSHFAAAFTLAVLSATAVHAETAVAGQKLDSGLGQLPHYSKWADKTGRSVMRVAGESLDNGTGELPHYTKWNADWRKPAAGDATVRVALQTASSRH